MLYFKTCSNTGPSIYWEMGNTMKHSALQKFNYVLLCLLIAGFLTVLIGVVESGGRFFYSEGEARIDVSWGVAYYKPELDPDPDSVLMRAEHRMYEYKKGRKL